MIPMARSEATAAYAWCAVLLAIAGVLLMAMQWASILAIFPLYFGVLVARSAHRSSAASSGSPRSGGRSTDRAGLEPGAGY